MSTAPEIFHSACPHDCPSTCALEVERLAPDRVGRIRGARKNTYTDGVICSKVARYAERLHHPERLTHPLRRCGAKGDGEFERIGWEDALDTVAEALLKAEQRLGAETVWPYYYCGNMGLVMRDGINRLRHAKRYSGQHSTICVGLAWAGYQVGTGVIMGVDPREMAESDVIVIWGTNAAATQINVMSHALAARRKSGAHIVVVDVYRNATAEQADTFLCVRPGTDGALACAVMHVLFRDGLADWNYLERYTDKPHLLQAHLATRSPAWASAICGVPVADIEAFARLLGAHRRSFFRLGYGFTRQRNGAANMHAVTCIPAVLGAWQHHGGGALHATSAMYHMDSTLIEGTDVVDPTVRLLDQSRIGPVLNGEPFALAGGPPISALFIQNTNPMLVAPDLNAVARGFAREDLFTCVHEQFMTETALMADIVLPATMFLEQEDLYVGSGHGHILFGEKIVVPPGECRSNHEVVCALAKRLGARHRGFELSVREIIDETLRVSGWGDLARLEREHWLEVYPAFEQAHFIDGFAHADRRFHFVADWEGNGPTRFYAGDIAAMPTLPDHWDIIESPTSVHPFQLVTAPARHFLNSSFNETPTSQRRERRPTLLMHPQDARQLGVDDGVPVIVSNARGAVQLEVSYFDGVLPGVVIAEGLWPRAAHAKGLGINELTGADAAAPFGGAAFHDNRVAIALAS